MSLEKNDVTEVYSTGGFTIKPLDENLLRQLEENIKILFGKQDVDNEKFLKLLHLCNEARISELFDLFNSCGNVLGGHLSVQNAYIKDVFSKPVIWGYPNVRIDKISRSEYVAPPHLDEWILFNENKGIVAWFPLFSDGFLKIYDYQGELNVIKDDYWGLKAKNIGDFKYNEQVVKRGNVLFFRSDVLHESSLKINADKVRVSIQYRYIDSSDYKNSFKRPVTQKISDLIKTKQDELIMKNIS